MADSHDLSILEDGSPVRRRSGCGVKPDGIPPGEPIPAVRHRHGSQKPRSRAGKHRGMKVPRAIGRVPTADDADRSRQRLAAVAVPNLTRCPGRVPKEGSSPACERLLRHDEQKADHHKAVSHDHLWMIRVVFLRTLPMAHFKIRSLIFGPKFHSDGAA